MKLRAFIAAAVVACALPGCESKGSVNNAKLLRSKQRQQITETQDVAPEERLQIAIKRLELGNIDEAESIAQELLIADPGNASIIMLAASCQAERGNLIDAAKMMDDITGDEDQVAAALEQASDWLIDADRLDQAQQKLERLIELQGPSNRILHQLVVLANNQGRRMEAKPYLDALLRSGDATEKELFAMNCFADSFIDETLPPPQEPRQWTMTVLGEAKSHWFEGKLHQARALADGLARHFPDSAPVTAFQGLTYSQLQDEPALIEWAKDLPDAIEEQPEYWRAIALWLQRQGHHRQAVRCFAEAVLIDQTDRYAYLGLAQSLLAAGEDEAAQAATQRFDLLAESARIVTAIGLQPGTRQQLNRLSELTGQLRRPWEAVGWQEVAAKTLGVSDQQRQQIRSRRQRLSETQEDSSDPDHWRTCGVDPSKWPLPTPDMIEIQADSTAGSTAELVTTRRPILLVNVAPAGGFDFQYDNGDDPSDDRVFLHQLTGGGIGVVDYDLDGWPDICMTQAGGDAFDATGSKPNQLFKNVDGKSFLPVGPSAGISDRGYGQGVAVADLNQDGFPDLVVANIGPNVLYINNGDGTFQQQELLGQQAGDWTTTIACGDLSGDHLPDIVEVNYVDDPTALNTPCVGNDILCNPSRFRPAADRFLWNSPSGSFRQVVAPSPVAPSHGFAAVIANFDKQAGNDLFIANDADRNHFWRDVSAGEDFSLAECGQVTGCATGLHGANHGCMGIATGDFDRNGRMDLHVTNFWNQPADLYLQHNDGIFINKTVPYRIYNDTRRTVGWGTQAVDFDRDGWLDLATLNGHVTDRSHFGESYRMRPQLFRGLANRFDYDLSLQRPNSYWDTPAHARTMATLDWNRDGRPDLVTNHLHSPAALLENQTEIANWVQLELVGTDSERDAVGAEVSLHAGEVVLTAFVTGGDGFLCSNEAVVDFGIGTIESIDRIEITWPAGTKQSISQPRPNQRYLIIEGKEEHFAR